MFYDKDELKEQLELEQIYDLISELGGEPEYCDSGLISQTICHNPPGAGSRKLYYYANSKLCQCYTSGCEHGSFDIFELVIKAMRIQKNVEWGLPDAMQYVAAYFGIAGQEKEETAALIQDWQIFKRYEITPYAPPAMNQLKEYDPTILTRFSYPRIASWEAEGISPEVIRRNLIGYYPTTEQITIPHFDINGRFIGLRGRFLAAEDAERWGKYRPIQANGILYSHPLSMNLYNLNNSKDNIKKQGAAILFESEKSTLQFQSFYGPAQDISVACCGSNISSYQIELLQSIGAKEIILALDRQFTAIGDNEFKQLKNKLINLYRKYGHQIKISAIFDKEMITPYKASPTDISKDIFEYLLEHRIEPKG